jgi:hypothetical protein
MARPSHKPVPELRRQVEALAGFGIPEADIAGLIGIDPKTLRKHYRQELDRSHQGQCEGGREPVQEGDRRR